MKLYVARHGKTNYNDLGLCNADPTVDVHLTSKGIEQAEALASKLSQKSIDRIFVSELRRTQQTAAIVNEGRNIAVEVDNRLDDGRSGFEGQPYEMLDKAMEVADDQWTARFNDGESIEDLKLRVREFLEELRTKQYESVLVVTSSWNLYAMFVILRGMTNEEAWASETEQGDYYEFKI